MRWFLISVFFFLCGLIAIAQVSAGPNDTICRGETTTLQGSGPGDWDYIWTSVPDDPTISNPNILDPEVQPDESTVYTLTGTKVTDINLVDNGDFEQGNTGFTSDYDYCDYANCLSSSPLNGEYGVGNDPNFLHVDFPSCGDHTSGSGNMMIVNGAGILNTTLYEITVLDIEPNTNYEFSTWITNLTWTLQQFLPDLQFEINGTVIGHLTPSAIECTWNEFLGTWNSQSATSATIRIVNLTIELDFGNDFAIDDVALFEILEDADDCIVDVLDIPTSTFNMASQLCLSDSAIISYTGNAPPSPTATYHWNFGTNANILNGTDEGPYLVEWTSSGVKTVTLWVETDCLSAVTTNIITINPNPDIDVTADATSIPYGTNTILHGVMGGNPGPLDFEWSPASMLVDPLNQNPQTISLEASTMYFINVADLTSSCNSVDSILIEVTGGPLTIISLTCTPDIICPGLPSELLLNVTGGSGNYNVTWTSNPPGFNYQGPEMSVSVSPTETTTYFAEVNDQFNIASSSVEVAVLPVSQLTSQPQDLVLISGASATFNVTTDFATEFQWQVSSDSGNNWSDLIDGGVYSGANNPSLTINPVDGGMNGNMYRCIISGDCNNITSEEAILSVISSTDFVSSLDQANVCVGDTFLIACTVSNFIQIIDFNLAVEFGNNLMIYSRITNVSPILLVDIQESTSGNSITISWSSANDLTLPDGKLFDFVFIALSDGTSDIIWDHQLSNVTNQPGFYPDMILADGAVEINPLSIPPDYVISDKDTINIVDVINITLTAEGGSGDELIWSLDDCNGVTIGTGSPLEILRPEQTSVYYAYWLNQCGMSSCKDVQIVIVYDFNIGIPNAYTPNGDGLNDEFKIVCSVILDEFQMQIFDRWGQLIFETSDQYNGWDGTYKGSKLNPGSYVWKIAYKFDPAGAYYQNVIKTGTVMVIN